MELVSQSAARGNSSRVVRKVSVFSAALLGMCTIGSVQAVAATLTCGTPLTVTTANKAAWSTDAQLNDGSGTATIVDDYGWGGWFDPAAQTPALAGKWLSFGDGTQSYPVVNTRGNTANGAWVQDFSTFIYGETITVASNVDLSTIKVTGRGGADNQASFVVKPATLPGGVANNTPTPWVQSTPMLGGAYGAPAAIDLSSGNLGFSYGANAIGLAFYSEATTAVVPGGIVADLEITADCQGTPPPQPTTSLMCPVGNQLGQTVRIGPFTTNARDWKWTWRTNAGGNALENVEQPLFDDFRYRGYFNPNALPTGQETNARWISPGTTDPSAGDIPGLPYPFATGQAKSGYHASVFVMNQPVTVGNNVDLSSVKLEGRFGFDDYGNSVFVQPVGGSPVFDNAGLYMPNGYGSFQTATTPAIPGFARGKNTIGLMLDGLQSSNDCDGGTCAMAAIADFYLTATCTGEPPIVASATPVPTLDVAGLGLLGVLGAGMGAWALRRRKHNQ